MFMKSKLYSSIKAQRFFLLKHFVAMARESTDDMTYLNNVVTKVIPLLRKLFPESCRLWQKEREALMKKCDRLEQDAIVEMKKQYESIKIALYQVDDKLIKEITQEIEDACNGKYKAILPVPSAQLYDLLQRLFWCLEDIGRESLVKNLLVLPVYSELCDKAAPSNSSKNAYAYLNFLHWALNNNEEQANDFFRKKALYHNDPKKHLTSEDILRDAKVMDMHFLRSEVRALKNNEYAFPYIIYTREHIDNWINMIMIELEKYVSKKDFPHRNPMRITMEREANQNYLQLKVDWLEGVTEILKLHTFRQFTSVNGNSGDDDNELLQLAIQLCETNKVTINPAISAEGLDAQKYLQRIGFNEALVRLFVKHKKRYKIELKKTVIKITKKHDNLLPEVCELLFKLPTVEWLVK